ncbi:helix-turn-helix domain containing protein [Pontibacillus salipaludis]|uniref:Helix-turn-helix domain containing protein n=1 Tax=Pontibacillus salipaludis TaxID=1697394 RepID=A0ABQ1PWQ2_9BACI|nr:helix-turn-helix domain containing protein [Pontibacillus salipaludis]GGD05188.1 hypothetical protein GCM10011389_10860 [Pontibacillus salipaludis]
MSIYIAHEEAGFDWNNEDVKRFQEYWNQGYSIVAIAKMLRRTQLDVALLGLDQTVKGLVSKRYGGALGDEWGRQPAKRSG